ncbi:DUF1330 domain-containing protein [Bradyrhizobium erythrophlei]|uniref:Uncharacterized conserved protein, DUF1330 family n=1 Tax=Bradyrhizobium erythrophlei TaxID=1437360 RepID=A0A1H4WT21_9BRAD|nr:DUF1330 domain-containing protein [Bradyrhizobium erythrophlei]SEC96375.1 Uncharacterized conserved protein, DUF1330 family [Bradyrhizobium erythrophlei]
MSAYVIVEATVRDKAARERYSAQVGPILRKFDGEILAAGPWQALFGEPAFENGMVVRFPDKATAFAWYHSPDYQGLLELRDEALDCRFRIVGS